MKRFFFLIFTALVAPVFASEPGSSPFAQVRAVGWMKLAGRADFSSTASSCAARR